MALTRRFGRKSNAKSSKCRPNIVIDSFGEGRPLDAWEEDKWDAFEIGEGQNGFYGVSRCARCTVRLPDSIGLCSS
jgi:uncharacterized protein YcbX